MFNFSSDYTEGCHPQVLKALCDSNMEQLKGYGGDNYTESAVAKIKKAIGKEAAEIFLLTGGTQTNQVVIDTMLANYEGVVAAETGHVAVHEAGAIEFGGHKVLTLPSHEGRIEATDLRLLLEKFYGDDSHEHMVFPGMVYISHPTEYGTLYTKAQLLELKQVCTEYKLPLYMDGARLGYGLMSAKSDVSLQEIAEIADVFYIGGTKVGALCGEAVVFSNIAAPKHFLTQVKQHGAMLAKGRVNGVQFDALFTDDLYYHISANAIRQAEKMVSCFKECGYRIYMDSPTNQQFIVVSDRQLEVISEEIIASYWEKLPDGGNVIRLCTGWATTDEQMDVLCKVLRKAAHL